MDFIPRFEFIFGKEIANTISDNKADIQVEYTKKGFENGEAKPYYYYDCRDISDDDVTRVTALITSAGCLVAYMLAEGYSDGKNKE